MMDGLRFVPIGYQQITDLSSAVGLVPPSGATMALIKAEGQAVRWRDDGTPPTASSGMPIGTADAPFSYTGTLSKIKFIEQTSGAKLDVSYYRQAG